MKKPVFYLLYLIFISTCVSAQIPQAKDTTPFYMMSLEQLMNLNVTVSSQLPMINREAPGAITVISEDEIKNSGAKDLMQILQQVPGFAFGVDVDGVVGVGFRGNWVYEGKILFLLDGMDLSEDLYSTNQLGFHFPLDRIKHIEIIRGPGAAIYGGNAAFAVINIITYNDKDFNGIQTSFGHSLIKNTFGSRQVSLAVGKSLGNAHINLSTFVGEANRSNQKYTDYQGTSYDMTEQSRIGNTEYRLDFFLKGLSLTGRYNLYSVQQRDGYDLIFRQPYTLNFNMGNVNVKYDFRTKSGLNITPGIKLKFEEPWSYKKAVVDDDFRTFDKYVNKNTYYINTSYNQLTYLDIVAGLEYYNVFSKENRDTMRFFNGRNTFCIDNYAGFFQSVIKLTHFNIIFGNRIEYSPYFGTSYVPRTGITKVKDGYHLKALYSRSFRTPSIENINLNPDIKPEKLVSYELEFGKKLSSNSYLTSNIYLMKSTNTIIFTYDENLNDNYINHSCTGSYGLEIDYKIKTKYFFSNINYSYYHVYNHGDTCIYLVPGRTDLALGFARHTVNFNANIPLSKNIKLNPSCNYFSKRYSSSQDDSGIITVTEYNPSFYTNLSLNFENLFVKNFQLNFSCLNVFDEKTLYIQPYTGNHEPLPGTGREFQLKLNYSF